MHKNKLSRKKYNKAMRIPNLPSIMWNENEWFVDLKNKTFKRITIVKGYRTITIARSFESYIGKRMMAKFKHEERERNLGNL